MAFTLSLITPWSNYAEFIDDFFASTGGASVQVIVVDNASEADIACQLQRRVRSCGGVYLRNAHNAGFSAANNQGLAVATGEIVIFLNNDVCGGPGWLEEVRRDVTPGALFGPAYRRVEIEGVSAGYLEGWCVAARREVWDALGGWDAAAYPLPTWEDADLCLRAVREGFRLLSRPWPIIHKRNGTIRDFPGLPEAFAANRRTFARRLLGREPAAEPTLTSSVVRPAAPHRPQLPGEDAARNEIARSYVLREADDWEGSLRACRSAVAAVPGLSEAHNEVGNSLLGLGEPERAAESFRRAIQLAPAQPEPHANLGIALLTLGRWEEAWPEYEWRRKQPELFWRRAGRSWRGEDVFGCTVLLYAEGGVGNAIQFARYAGVLAGEGARVIVECPAEAVELMRGVEGVAQAIPRHEPPPHCDFHCPLVSVAAVRRQRWEDLAWAGPYLRPDPARVARVGEGLAAVRKLTVGLVWQADLRSPSGRRRSVPLEEFAPLAKIRDVKLFGLQHGWEGESEFGLAEIQVGKGGPGTFTEAAAMIRCMDLIVTNDTAAAHIAGAMGVPAWVLLPYAADWRWMRDREDTPWYPTMRLFRQSVAGRWSDVFERIRECLQAEGGQAV